MICSNCGNEQESGKFCGKCGTPLTAETAKETTQETPAAQTEEASPSPAPQAEAAAAVEQPAAVPNPSIEKAKQSSMQYLRCFTKYIKSPSQAFKDDENNWLNGLITIILVTTILAFTVYSVVNGVARLTTGAVNDFYYSDSMFNEPNLPVNLFGLIFPRAWTIFAATIASILLVIFGIIHAFIRPISFKSVVGMYGSFMLPVVVMSAAVWLLILIGSFTFAFIVFALTLSMITLIIPFTSIFLASENIKPRLDRVYIGLIYLTSYVIVTLITYYILLESTMVKIMKFVDQFA